MPNDRNFEFCIAASKEGLQEFELSKLNHASRIAKRVKAEVHEWVEELKWAAFARLLLEHEKELSHMGLFPLQEQFNFADQDVAESAGGGPRRATEFPEFPLRNANAA